MEQLGPEPFRRIDAADELQVVGREGGGMGVDGVGLFDGGVVFPQHEKGVGIVAEFGQQSQRGTRLVHGYGGRSGGIDGDGCYVAGCGGAGLSEAAADGLFESFDIIEGMLAEPVVRGFAIQAIHPAGVVKDGRGYFAAVGGVDEEGADGICSVIHAEYKVLFLHMAV
jgi:hypothetical protein